MIGRFSRCDSVELKTQNNKIVSNQWLLYSDSVSVNVAPVFLIHC